MIKDSVKVKRNEKLGLRKIPAPRMCLISLAEGSGFPPNTASKYAPTTFISEFKITKHITFVSNTDQQHSTTQHVQN